MMISRLAPPLAASILLAGCGQQPPPPPPVGVLLNQIPSASTYSLTLVRGTGQVVGQVNAHMRTTVSLGVGPGSALPAAMPVFSTTNDRAYYLDGDTDLRYVDSFGRGSGGVVAHVPGSAHSESGFAVRPDDRYIAVATIDYTVTPYSLTLYVQAFGGSPTTILHTSSTYLWPVGWHGGALVVALGAPVTQNQAANPYGTFTGYDVLNPANAGVLSTITCNPAGALSPAGTVCLATTSPYMSTLDFRGNRNINPSSTFLPGGAAISPDGSNVAYCCPRAQEELWVTASGINQALSATSGPTEAWIDARHVLTEGSLSQPPKVIDASSPTGTFTTVQAAGQAVGRIPGGL